MRCFYVLCVSVSNIKKFTYLYKKNVSFSYLTDVRSHNPSLSGLSVTVLHFFASILWFHRTFRRALSSLIEHRLCGIQACSTTHARLHVHVQSFATHPPCLCTRPSHSARPCLCSGQGLSMQRRISYCLQCPFHVVC